MLRSESSSTDPNKLKILEYSKKFEVDQKNYYSESTFKPPPFTYAELKEVIPLHLFKSSTLKSTIYLFVNLGACVGLGFSAIFITHVTSSSLRSILYFLYWIFQGIAGTGLWVIAHECGHGAFSPIKNLNHAVGFVLHSALLVPYHSWRISHAQHHAARGHVDKEPVFRPEIRRDLEPWTEAVQHSPIRTLGLLLTYLLVGWPAYLLTNASGQNYDKFASHFLPSSPIFKTSQRTQVIISNVGIAGSLCILGYLWYLTSLETLVIFYGVPYLVVNALLVSITLLQHRDVYLPYYSDSSWTFVKGALATVDRNFGWFLNHALHHIHDTHVVHHLFPSIPYYNSVEATVCLKAKLGDYYNYDETPIFQALWRVLRDCVFLEKSGEVLFYRK